MGAGTVELSKGLGDASGEGGVRPGQEVSQHIYHK